MVGDGWSAQAGLVAGSAKARLGDAPHFVGNAGFSGVAEPLVRDLDRDQSG